MNFDLNNTCVFAFLHRETRDSGIFSEIVILQYVRACPSCIDAFSYCLGIVVYLKLASGETENQNSRENA